jgi:gamma-glutamyl-gamma-aminobutyrate hydrolase PuuD
MSLKAALTFGYLDKAGPYAEALRQAGVEPVLMAPGEPRALAGLQGLLLSGGTDLNPARYGETPHPGNEATCRCWRSAAGCNCSTWRTGVR